MTERLSTLDASFLSVEGPTAHMHVGWKALFAPPDAGPRPTFETLRDHIATRLDAAPRYRQRLADVPLGAHHAVWVDDPDFDIRRHVRRAPPGPLDELVISVMSEPLHRDRPLWEMWLADELPDGRLAMVGKAHHCMVDGLAAVELTSMLLDLVPTGNDGPAARETSAPAPPGRFELLRGAVRDRLAAPLAIVGAPNRLVPTPRRVRHAAAATERAVRAVAHAASPAAPRSILNRPSSPHRHLAQLERSLDELRDVKRRHGTTVNDVLLAAVAGALRGYLFEHGEEPRRLKTMVPVSVRDADDRGGLGNRISFVFVSLPCDETEPAVRLADIAGQMGERKQSGEPEGADLAVQGAGFAPRFLQEAIAHLLVSPRVFNLVVSNVPGPPMPLYLRGCRLVEAYPIVPLAQDHALSIGMMTVAGRACFGLYADRRTLPDADRLVTHLNAALDELVALR
jgi:diacylglycerol O-acyltransferase